MGERLTGNDHVGNSGINGNLIVAEAKGRDGSTGDFDQYQLEIIFRREKIERIEHPGKGQGGMFK